MLFIYFQIVSSRYGYRLTCSGCLLHCHKKKPNPQVGRDYFFRQVEGIGKGNRVTHSVDILNMGRFKRITLESAKLKYDFFTRYNADDDMDLFSW